MFVLLKFSYLISLLCLFFFSSTDQSQIMITDKSMKVYSLIFQVFMYFIISGHVYVSNYSKTFILLQGILFRQDNFNERTKCVRKDTRDWTTLFKFMYVCIYSVNDGIQNCYYILQMLVTIEVLFHVSVRRTYFLSWQAVKCQMSGKADFFLTQQK